MGFNNFTRNNDTNNTNNTGNGTNNIVSSLLAQTQQDSDITDILINYNDKYAISDSCLFRDDVINQTLSILIGKNKPNALLIGSAGTGKTKIVEAIANKLANNDDLIPDKLKGYTIYELPLASMVAGASLVGQLEQNVQDIINFMSDESNKAILFIDEIHQIINGAIYEKIAQILKPSLARGDIKVIGATTLQEATNLDDDPAFNRRFTKVIIDELTKSQTIEVLKASVPSLMKHYDNKVLIPDNILPTVVTLADNYKSSGSHRPDNAVTLLDRSMSATIINHRNKIRAVTDKNMKQALMSINVLPLTEKQLKKVAKQIMTGNAKENEFDMDRLKTNLSVIKGQDDILKPVLDMIARHNTPYFPKTKPLTLLFAGSSGVGKTEIVKIIAQEVTGKKPITLNMTEYNSPASINRIIGSPAGYVGSDSKAELPFDSLEGNPYQIILLDEFEKSDKSVQRLFMSIFEEGVLKTNRNKEIDFSKAIIVATTNAGHKRISNPLGFGSQKTKNDDINNLSDSFDVELLNRFELILSFNDIEKPVYRTIVAECYEREVSRIKSEGFRITLADTLADTDLTELVEQSYHPKFGARPAKKAVQKYIEEKLM